MAKYKEIKSRHSVTKDFGERVTVGTTIPANTSHRGEAVQFRSLDKPPTWNCAKCGKVIRVEKPVNEAFIHEIEPEK